MLLSSAAPSGGGGKLFSADIWNGSSTQRDITTGVNVASGGWVWIKNRLNGSANYHLAWDTERGPNNWFPISSYDTGGVDANYLNAFNSDGFSLGTSTFVNANADSYVGYSWAEAEGFCDVVKYTGTGQANHAIAHDLGVAPEFMLVKRASGSSAPFAYHSGAGSTKGFEFSEANGPVTSSTLWPKCG